MITNDAYYSTLIGITLIAISIVIPFIIITLSKNKPSSHEKSLDKRIEYYQQTIISLQNTIQAQQNQIEIYSKILHKNDIDITVEDIFGEDVHK